MSAAGARREGWAVLRLDTLTVTACPSCRRTQADTQHAHEALDLGARCLGATRPGLVFDGAVYLAALTTSDGVQHTALNACRWRAVEGALLAARGAR